MMQAHGGNGSSPEPLLAGATHIAIPFAVDNLSEDAEGAIWAAAIPQGLKFFQHAKDPFGYTPPSTILKIRRRGDDDDDDDNGYDVEKVLEDRDGEMLPGTTTVVHDVTTGRLFMSGMLLLLGSCWQTPADLIHDR